MVRYIVAALLFLLLGYGLVKAWPLLSGPSLSIDIPENYTTSGDGFITLSGTSKNTESLWLNGGPLLIDQEGKFEKKLLLPSGGAILSFVATDRFGRSVSERRTVYVP